MIPLIFQNYLSHLGASCSSDTALDTQKHGKNGNYCFGYKSVQITLKIQYQSTCHSKSIFQNEGYTQCLVCVKDGKSNERGTSDIKILLH